MKRHIDEMQTVFESAAEWFGALSTPLRLRIIGALYHGEKHVGQPIGFLGVSQPNMSQQLYVMCRAGQLV